MLLFGVRQNSAHILSGQPGVLVHEIQTHGLAIHYRQGMAQFKAGVTFVSDIQEAEHFSHGFLVAFYGDAIRAAVVLAAVMPQRLQ